MSEIAIRLLSGGEFALTYTDPLGRVVVFGVGEMVEPTFADISGGVGRGEHPNLDVADSHPSKTDDMTDEEWNEAAKSADLLPPDCNPFLELARLCPTHVLTCRNGGGNDIRRSIK